MVVDTALELVVANAVEVRVVEYDVLVYDDEVV